MTWTCHSPSSLAGLLGVMRCCEPRPLTPKLQLSPWLQIEGGTHPAAGPRLSELISQEKCQVDSGQLVREIPQLEPLPLSRKLGALPAPPEPTPREPKGLPSGHGAVGGPELDRSVAPR